MFSFGLRSPFLVLLQHLLLIVNRGGGQLKGVGIVLLVGVEGWYDRSVFGEFAA